MFSVFIWFYYGFSELERLENVTVILPRQCRAVLTLFAGRGGRGRKPSKLIKDYELFSFKNCNIAINFEGYGQPLIAIPKMALYCPQGSGTLRQELLMMHGIAW